MKKCAALFLALLLISSSIAKPRNSKRKRVTHLPDIEVYDIHGKHTTLGALGKNKVTFIDNWFIPCPPCFREMGMLHKLYFKCRSNKNINFITICQTDTGIVKKFLAKDRSLATFVDWYQVYSKRSDFKLPIYFIPGCNEKIYTGTALSKYTPDDKNKCPDRQFGFKGYPTVLIFNKTGKLIFKRTGFGLNEDETAYMAKLEAIMKSGI